MTKKYATGFPLASGADLTDQIQAVKIGVDKQETWQQVFNLFQNQSNWIMTEEDSDFFIETTDNNTIFLAMQGANASFRELATYPAAFNCIVINNYNSLTVQSLITPFSGDTINNGHILGLGRGQAVQLMPDPISLGNWICVSAFGSGAQLPQISPTNSSTYTLQAKDNGAFVTFPASGTAKTLTIPANAALDVDTFYSIVNNPGTTTVAISSTETIIGSTTIAPNCSAIIYKTVYGTPGTWAVGLIVGSQYLPSGKQNLPILNVYAASTNPAVNGQTATQSNGATIPYWSFTPSGLSYLFVECMMPKRWDGGTITLDLSWFTSNPETAPFNVAVWFADAAVINSGDSINPTFGTAQFVLSNAFVGGNQLRYCTIPAITPSGTPSANATLQIRIYRNGGSGSDTLPDPALLRGIIVNYTSSAGNDA